MCSQNNLLECILQIQTDNIKIKIKILKVKHTSNQIKQMKQKKRAKHNSISAHKKAHPCTSLFLLDLNVLLQHFEGTSGGFSRRLSLNRS